MPRRINVIKLSQDPVMSSERKGKMEVWRGRTEIKGGREWKQERETAMIKSIIPFYYTMSFSPGCQLGRTLLNPQTVHFYKPPKHKL